MTTAVTTPVTTTVTTTVTTVAAAVLVAFGVLLASPVRPVVAPAVERRRRLVPAALGLLAGVVLVLGRVGGRLPVLAGAAAVVGLAVTRLRATRRRAAEAAQAAARVMEFCEAVSAELAAGAPALRALTAAAEEVPELASVAAAAALDADVAAQLRTLAREPGRADLRVAASAWQVSVRCGAGLAEALERAAATLRERRRTARAVQAELAPARATAQLMAVLPAVFLVAGSGLGGHPIRFLTATTPGSVCLLLGLFLSCAGLVWLELIAGSVEQQ